MRLTATIATLVSIAVFAAPASNGGTGGGERVSLTQRTDEFVTAILHRQLVMGVPLTKSNYTYKRSPSKEYKLWAYKHWKALNWKVLQQYRNPPHYGAWLCIHGGEGSWQASTGNGYYGGLQMDYGFQETYGKYLLLKKGTANNWTPLEQMWIAEHAHASGRGFWPWPNTARACGLL